MTYEEALGFWYGRINYEVRAAEPADLKLERMRSLLQRLGDPHERMRLIHVTGTKGKGSTAAMIASILRASGYRVGLFTSPHLEHVEERIQVNGVPIRHGELCARMVELASVVREMEAESNLGVTFFELGTALGFLHFWRRRCEVAVIEVGLGGRFDSTNVCRPLVSVITNVGFDHTAQLGNTLEAIAYQKAGIIKRSVPVVSGVEQPGPREVVRQVAAEMHAPLWERGTEFDFQCTSEKLGSTLMVRIVTPQCHYPPIALGMVGEHQAANAATAVAAIERLRDTGMPISDLAVRRGLEGVRCPARIECIGSEPTIILDSAHNVPSAEALVRTLRESFPVLGRKSVVFAVSFDKQFAEILGILARYFDYFYLTKYGNNPRSVPPEKLASLLCEQTGRKAFSVHSTATEAWNAAQAEATRNDLICITGSVFLAGELLPLLTR